MASKDDNSNNIKKDVKGNKIAQVKLLTLLIYIIIFFILNINLLIFLFQKILFYILSMVTLYPKNFFWYINKFIYLITQLSFYT